MKENKIKGVLRTGSAKSTDPGDLTKLSKVIHAVGPDFSSLDGRRDADYIFNPEERQVLAQSQGPKNLLKVFEAEEEFASVREARESIQRQIQENVLSKFIPTIYFGVFFANLI